MGINRSAVINDRTKKTLLSRRGTLEEGVARHRAGKGVERRGCFQVELQATPLCTTLGFDPFLFSPSQGDCRLKGNADTGPLMLEKRDVSLIIFSIPRMKRKKIVIKKINLRDKFVRENNFVDK